MTAALVAIPILIHNLGAARFGVLTLIWGMVRYSSYCDFGIGTALTKLLAERLGRSEIKTIPSLIWTSLVCMLLVGMLVGAIVAGLCPWVVTNVLKIPPMLRSETVKSFYLLGASMPFLILAIGLRSTFAAYQCFGTINVVRGPMDVASYVGLIVLAKLDDNLILMIAMLMSIRMLGLFVYLLFMFRMIPGLYKIRFDLTILPILLGFGGWMALSNLVNPLLGDFERLLIGAVISIEAVAYYNTSVEMLSKLWQIPLMLDTVWFSAFANDLAQCRVRRQRVASAESRLQKLFEYGDLFIFVLMFCAILILAGFSREILGLWVGRSFAVQMLPAFRLLVLVVIVSAFSSMPGLLIQAAHRPDFTARLRLAEAPLAVLLAWKLAVMLGLAGVALAVLVRALIDTVGVSLFANRLFPSVVSFWRRMLWMAAASGVAFTVGQLKLPVSQKVTVILSILCIFGAAVWHVLLSSEGKRAMANLGRNIPQLLFGVGRAEVTGEVRAKMVEE